MYITIKKTKLLLKTISKSQSQIGRGRRKALHKFATLLSQNCQVNEGSDRLYTESTWKIQGHLCRQTRISWAWKSRHTFIFKKLPFKIWKQAPEIIWEKKGKYRANLTDTAKHTPCSQRVILEWLSLSYVLYLQFWVTFRPTLCGHWAREPCNVSSSQEKWIRLSYSLYYYILNPLKTQTHCWYSGLLRKCARLQLNTSEDTSLSPYST